MLSESNERLRVSVLGAVRAWLGAREVDLGATRQRTLFAVLAVAAGGDVGRDELIAGIWGVRPPVTAAGSVHTYISGLRRILGRDVLTSGPSGYALKLTPEDLDSGQFVELIHRAAELRTAGELRAAVALLDEAKTWWKGEPYAALSGDPIEQDRKRLTDWHLAGIELHARITLELGDEDTIANLTNLVIEYPLHEPWYELLMLGLHRTGRCAEAIEVFRAARRTLRAELGVEPSPALTELYQRVLAGAPDPVAYVALQSAQVAGELRDGPAGGVLAGRDNELERLRELVREVVAGRGATVWVEGEPGIGKTELLTVAFDDAVALGCRVAWGRADGAGIDESGPIQLVMRALRAERSFDGSPQPAVELSGGADNESSPTALADRVLADVRAACTAAPLVLVLDDLQHSDEGGVLFWDRLVAVTVRMPLLLVASARWKPAGHRLGQLRRSVQIGQGQLITLGALSSETITDLVARLVGAPLGPNLAVVVAWSGGNPLYIRELVASLRHSGAMHLADGRADIAASAPIPTSPAVLAAVWATVELLSSDTQQVLRMATLLGTRFAVDDVMAVTGRSPFVLLANLEEALAAGVVVDTAGDLVFRHPLLRQALADSIPAPARAGLHRQTAEALDRAGRPVARVAEQLAAQPLAVDAWVVSWLTRNQAEVVRRAPQLAAGLLRQTLGSQLPTADQRATLLVALATVSPGQDQLLRDEAWQAASSAVDPALRTELRQSLAALTFRHRDADTALDMLTQFPVDPVVPEIWRTRQRVLLAHFSRGDLADLDRAELTADRLLTEAGAQKPFEAAVAVQTRWLTSSIRRDHERALAHVDRALNILHAHPTYAGMYFDLLDNRVFTLHNLDRLTEAERTAREGTLFAIRHRLPSPLPLASAVQHYWLGRWDDALADIISGTEDVPGTSFLTMIEPDAVNLLRHGVAALIAVHRDDANLAAVHLDATNIVPVSRAERGSYDFLLVARALAAEQRNSMDEAFDLLAPLLDPEYAPMMLRHQWLPGVVRLALAQNRKDIAKLAATLCAAEADKEVQPARAWAADLHCQALLSGAPEPALTAAAHYRRVARVPELAAALEDAAVLLAIKRRPHDSARTSGEAVVLYTRLGARWDLRRAHQRLVEVGIEPEPADWAGPS